MKFGITPSTEERRQRSKKRSAGTGSGNLGGSDNSIAATTTMTAENTTSDQEFDFDDFCCGGGGDAAAIAQQRIENGECPGCGVLCYEIDQFTGARGRPLDEPGAIEDGICLLCEINDPTNMNNLAGGEGRQVQGDGLVVTQAEYCVRFDKPCAANELPLGKASRSQSNPLRSKRPSLLLFGSPGTVRRASLTASKPSTAVKSKQAEMERKILKCISTLMHRSAPDASMLASLTDLIALISKDEALAAAALTNGVIPVVFGVMSRYQAHAKIQCRACNLICLLTQDSAETPLELVASNQGVSSLLELMQAHSENIPVLREAAVALYQVTALPKNAGEIISNSSSQTLHEGKPRYGIRFVLDLLSAHEDDSDVATHLMGVLYHIGKVQISSFSQFGALLDIVLRVMRKNKKIKDMQRVGCMLLHLLASECPLETRIQLVKLNAVSQLMSCLKNAGLSASSPEGGAIVVQHAFLTLSALAVSNAGARIEIINYKDRTGLNIIMECMKKHESSAHVQTEGCRLLKYLSNSDDEAGRRTRAALKGKSSRKVVDRAHGIVAQEGGSELARSIRI